MIMPRYVYTRRRVYMRYLNRKILKKVQMDDRLGGGISE